VLCVDGGGLEVSRDRVDDLGGAVLRLIEGWAQDELDGDGRQRALAIRAFWLGFDAFAAQDWEHLNRLYADDVTLVDHRLLGWGDASGRWQLLDRARGLAELADDSRIEPVDILALNADASLMRLDVTGSHSGGAFLMPMLVLAQFGQDGTVSRIDYFDSEQLEEAWAAGMLPRTTRPNRQARASPRSVRLSPSCRAAACCGSSNPSSPAGQKSSKECSN